MEPDNEDGCGKEVISVRQRPSLTLLPPSVANAVSLVAKSSSLYLRLGAFIGRLTLYGVRNSTLTGLELSRAVMENILIRAGKDVADRTSGGLGEIEAEGILDKSLTQLHSTMTKISFALSTGFHLSSAVMDSVCNISQLLLTALDSIFGSTDSSRAIAGIITLIRREFQNPATGREGEKVGVKDLFVGITGLALLQRWCRRITDAEDDSTVAVWDVVVLDNGKRADILGDHRLALVGSESMILVPDPSESDIMRSVEQHEKNIENLDNEMPEAILGKSMVKELPQSARISINTQTKTTKIITVVTTGAKPPNISLPPEVELVEEEPSQFCQIENGGDILKNKQESSLLSPRYRMIYRAQRDTCNQFESPGKLGHELLSQAEINDESNPLKPGINFSPIFAKDLGKYSEIPKSNLAECNEKRSHPEISLDNLANQKRSRKPANTPQSNSPGQVVSKKLGVKCSSKNTKNDQTLPFNPTDRKVWTQNSWHNGSTSIRTNLISRKSEPEISQEWPWRYSLRSSPCLSSLRDTALPILGDVSRLPQLGNANAFSSQELLGPELSGSTSRPGYYHLNPSQRSLTVASQPESFSSNPTENFPVSRTDSNQLKMPSLFLRSKSEKETTSNTSERPSLTNHKRSKSYVSSIYTLNSSCSSSRGSMIFKLPSGPFSDIGELSRTGIVDGIFPKYHLVRNVTRYIRFASASYGSNFLRVMGITTGDRGREVDANHHYEHLSFSTHTQLPPSTILLSSFVDYQGGTDSTGNTNTGVPMVHFVSLDHDSKAVVLTCRGTLGFEDVLTDMTCDYDEIIYQGKAYEVHKGIHASARRLLDGGGRRVMNAIGTALNEFPDYGLVMCGHSLGAAVSTLLAVMISEPNATYTAFFTASLPLFMTDSSSEVPIQFPKGRPIHVYAYGPPATMSSSLRMATRRLVTTIINDQDLVPYLSLGLLHDLQAIALAFKTDDTGAKSEVTKRVWQGITGKFSETWHNNQRNLSEEDDQWAYSTLKTLRACMLSSKLVPPGEVFIVETMPVLQRHGHIKGPLGRPATRVIFRYVKDVEKRFREMQFGGNMLLDHSPARYEANLSTLSMGTLVK